MRSLLSIHSTLCNHNRTENTLSWWQVTPKHLYTLDPTKSEWANFMLSRHSVRIYQETRAYTQLVGEHSTTVVSAFRATPCMKSGISVCELISTLYNNKNFKAYPGYVVPNPPPPPPKFSQQGKSHHTQQHTITQ